jgi:hypothetical protein
MLAEVSKEETACGNTAWMECQRMLCEMSVHL